MADPYSDDTLPEQPTGRDAIVAAMMSPQQRFRAAQQGIDTGPDTPTPEEIEAVRARTANTRGLASQGWEAGTQPIIPYDWATQENMPNPASGILHNIATMPAAAADTMLRGARGAYLGGIGALAGGAGDLGLEPHPDQLARAIPEGLNVLGAATAQPEFSMLPRFPAATRFATKYPGEVMGDLAAPYAKAFESAYQAVPEGAGLVGGRLKQPAQVIRDKAIEQGFEPPNRSLQKGIIDPQRMFAPGIYKDPREIAAEAAAQLEPEHPAMKALFGVNRQDLYDIGQQGTRPGNMEPQYAQSPNPRPSYVGQGLMTPANAQRIQNVLTETEKASPELAMGMKSWYVMDPAYQRLEQMFGPEEAARRYQRFNTLGSMASPGSDVLTEINRGTAAHMMAQRGQFADFLKYGGTAEANRGANFPDALRDVAGHAYHSTAQAGPMDRYLASGVVDMTSPKVPLYMQASGVPETGFQTRLPVPDAHFTRAIGAADVRTTAKPGVSMKGPEYGQVGPWFREQVAKPLGIEAVPAQGFTWGAFAPQTGVDTAIGAPKLELLSKRMWDRAQQLGIDPRELRDQVLRGEQHSEAEPKMGSVAAVG